METSTSSIVMDIVTIFGWLVFAILFFVIIRKSFVQVAQGTVGIITRFGKLQKIAQTGLSFKVPFIDVLMKTISTQNISTEVKFQAITHDQANVFFNAMILYSVVGTEDGNVSEDTIKNVAFKFVDIESFKTALVRSIESSVRGFVSAKKQTEVLQIRAEIIEHVKKELDTKLKEWGYHLIDVQMNDITFDKIIMDSMAQVVASANLKAAAENQGQALLITKTKAAEAEGAAIKISAEAERDAAKMRGEGIAQFREEVANGLKKSAQILGAEHDGLTAFTIWVEGMKHIAENGEGNVIFFDGSAQGMENTLKQMQGLNLLKKA